MSALEEVRTRVREAVARNLKEGKHTAFACACKPENFDLFSRAIDEYCEEEGIHRCKFTNDVYYSLFSEGFDITVDVDMWQGISARSSDHADWFYMQCDFIDHGMLYLLLAFEDWDKEREAKEARESNP